jgi:hypothetical protein
VRRRAECTWLSPASYSASFPCNSATCFGVRLRARGCCGFRFRLCGAAQRYPSLFWTAPSAPRSSSSAMLLEWPLTAAKCSGVRLHGQRRRGLGRRTHGRFAASANGAPVAGLGVHVGVGIDERSDHSAIAAFRRIVQRGVAIPVHGGAGVWGWAPRGYPSTQPVPEHKTALRPRGSTKCSLTVESTPGGLGVLAISHPARASIKRAKLQKVAGTAIAGEGGGEKL